MLGEAEEDILAFYAFSSEHWPKLRSTNPLGRFNREVGRRADVVGIFPDDASLIRLVSMLAIEANDEWLVGRGSIDPSPRRLSNSQRRETPTTRPTI
jgi:putative transposase